MGRFVGLALIALQLAACTATMVNPPGGSMARSRFAPVNETTKTAGLIKYLNQGAATMHKSRREDAYRQMHGACHGAYRIDAEGAHEEGGVVVTAPAGAPAANQ